jgi:hypothetical protein
MDSSPFIFRFLSDHRRGGVREQGKEATAWSVNMIDELSNLQIGQITTPTRFEMEFDTP